MATPKRSKPKAKPTPKKHTKNAAPPANHHPNDDENSLSQSQPLSSETETQPIPTPQPALERPGHDELIAVQTVSDRLTTNVRYKDSFEDSEHGKMKKVVIYDPDFPRSVNSVLVAGTLYCTWDEVILWWKREGESDEEYEERKKHLITDPSGGLWGARQYKECG